MTERQPTTVRAQGRVQRIPLKNGIVQGYGFIRGDDGQDFFFHYTELQNSDLALLREGQRVTFEPAPGPSHKGPRANNVIVETPALPRSGLRIRDGLDE